nr:uncharacterized protein LOC113701943 [Coffea arabica]
MVFNDFIRRRLASLLQPWLSDEPDLGLKLGFLRSTGTVKNLNFNTSVLNQLLDESTCYRFKEVAVDELSLGVSYWSFPAFILRVRGLRITLSVGEEEEEGGNERRKKKPRDTSVEDKKKVLAEIDPVGSALHDAIAQISQITVGSRKDNLLTAFLRHCQLQINEIHLLLLPPSCYDPVSCLLKIKEVGVQSKCNRQICFFGGLISSLFIPSRKCSFGLDLRDVELGLQSESSISCVISPTDMFISFKLKDLQITDSALCLPALKFSFSPADIYVISLFSSLSCKEPHYVRTGRQLWRIAASRISSLIPIPKLSWYRVVIFVKLWLYYLHIYEDMLLLIGYPVGDIVKKSSTMMLSDKTYSRSVKNHWDVISECEEKLPAEVIAQARHISRYRASESSQMVKQKCDKPQVKRLLWKIYQLLALIWAITSHVLHSVGRLLHILRVLSHLANQPKSDQRSKSVPDDSFPKTCFSLNVGKFSISVSPEKNVLSSVSGLPLSALRFSFDDLSSFLISSDAIILTYLKNISDQHLMFACGCVKVVAESLKEDQSGLSSTRLTEHQNNKIIEPQELLWCEPIEMINNHADDTEGASIPLLEFLVRKLWLNWKIACSSFEGDECKIPEAPCFLFENNCSLIGQSAKNPTYGSCEVLMVVGRSNFVLKTSSFLSSAVIYLQIQQALRRMSCRNGTDGDLHLKATCEHLPVVDLSPRYKSVLCQIETAMVKLVPQKKFQVGMMIAGPRIRLLFDTQGFLGENADLYSITKKDELTLVFDVDDIKLVVSPNLASNSKVSTGLTVIFDGAPSGLKLEEPLNIDIPNSTNQIYCCQEGVSHSAYLKVNGLKACFGELCNNRLQQIVTLSSTTVQASSSSRKESCSLGSTIIALSTALHWIAPGITAVVFLDELSVLVKVVCSLYYDVSHALTFFGSSHHRSCQELLRPQVACASDENEETLVNRKDQIPSACMDAIFGFRSICELEFMDVVVYNSRKSHNTEDHIIESDEITRRMLTMASALDCGIHISIQLTCGKFSFEDGIPELVIDLSGFQCTIVRYPTEIAECSDLSEVRNLLLSVQCLSEASLSHCKFALCLRTSEKPLSAARQRYGLEASTSCVLENPIMEMNTKRSRDHSYHWLSANVSLGEINLADCTVKNMLLKTHKSDKLNASFSVGDQFQTIWCQSKGGSTFLQMEAAMMFVHCLTLYCHLIGEIWRYVPSPDRVIAAQYGEPMVASNDKPAQDSQQLQKTKWDKLEAFSISISDFTLALLARDEFGRFQELLFETNVHLSAEGPKTLNKVSFEISKFSILSQFLHEAAEHQATEIQVPHFSAVACDDISSSIMLGDPLVIEEHENTGQSVTHDSSFMSTSAFQHEPFADNLPDLCDNTGSKNLHSSPQSYILKELCAVIAVEWPVKRDGTGPLYINQLWVGKGSISGFDMVLSLSQLRMILSVVESLSGVYSEEKSSNSTQRRWSLKQESEGSFREKIPDGSIVAIEDVYQHTYIAVEEAESGYNLVGKIHYSLVGERALFRVKHQNPGRWKPRAQSFSLISLYAKNASGEPLRLNGRPRSDFVDVSGTTDSSWALWSMLPYGSQSDDGNFEWEHYSIPAKNTIYLVNNKNNRSVAFIDGVLEFVSKPGNPFKCKVFSDLLPFGNNLFQESCSVGAPGTVLEYGSKINDDRELKSAGKLQEITIVIDKATLTVVHELSDTVEKFPLLQGSLSPTEIIVQMSNTKVRFMSSLEIMLHHFDAQRNIWRELVNPLEICLFFRYRFLIQGSENVLSGVPGHLYIRIKELNISISELSLDVLLFVIGNLKLAGPFAVRSSMILANCCKVENKSGLTLLCQFFDNQNVLVAGRQSSTIFLRHLALANRPPEASFFSIQLADKGTFATSLMHLSLSEARAFAWRTRIVSSHESKTSPGPFIVVEVSQTTEDGLSIIVSPLLRIHNETDFSMELRFRRPKEEENEFASLILDAGDSVDDSMATFSGVSLSGGPKKALMSLTVGNFLFSFRPQVTDDLLNFKLSSVEWSNDLRGGKPVPLSGLFEKLSYQVRTAFAVESVKSTLGTARCAFRSEGGHVANIYFLIQSVARDVPIIQPDNLGYSPGNRNVPIALQEQKEIFLLPTVHVSNLLETEIHVHLTDADIRAKVDYDNICSQATIPCGSAVNLYANPANIFFTVTLTSFGSSCKPVNGNRWVKKLRKSNTNAHQLDVELDFGGGKYFAFLRLSRGQRGILEAAVYTSYTLGNDTQFSLYCFAGNLKPLSRDEVKQLGSGFPPELGAYLPPNSRRSWFMKHHKLRIKLDNEQASEALLNLDALSGLTEIDLEVEENSGIKNVTRLGISLNPSLNKIVPSQLVSMSPRHIVLNESQEFIHVRQCYLEDDMQGIITINSKHRAALTLQKRPRRKGETTIFENLLRKHSKTLDDSLLFIQFRPNDASFGWSGPVCVASLGQFFLKFRRFSEYPARNSDYMTSHEPSSFKFAAVHVVEEDSALVLHFHSPPNADLPYRIENCLHDTSITYYQKGSLELETLRSGCCVDYAWDDLSLPHKLVVQIDDVHLLKEISMDKVRAWKPFYRAKQQMRMGIQFLLDMKPGEKNRNNDGQLINTRTVKLGYEVYAEGLTRVLRICEFSDGHKGNNMFYSSSKMRLRISHFAFQLLEYTDKSISLGNQLFSSHTPPHTLPIPNCKAQDSNPELNSREGSKSPPLAIGPILVVFLGNQLDCYLMIIFIQFEIVEIGTFKLISKCIDKKGFSGTKRYFGDLGKTLKVAGSNILFAAVTEVSDSVLKGAETSGFNGMMRGFRQGILKLAMEPSLLGTAFMEGGPDRKIKLDRAPGVDELYIEGYLQALLDALYNQEYLRVRVTDNQVILKNLPPNSSLINEIVERVKGFLVSKGLLKGDSSTTSHSLRHIRGESEWRIGPTVLTLCEHLFVSFAIRFLRKQAGKVISRVNVKEKLESDTEKAIVPISTVVEQKVKLVWQWGIGKFVLSGIVAYIDGRLCRSIPNPIARRVVSGFLLSFLDKEEKE